MPRSTITLEEIQRFKNQKKFYYLEHYGDRTYVTMKKGKWTETFPDKAYSKLTYNWLTDAEFGKVKL